MSDAPTEGVTVSHCTACGHDAFPERLWCPMCQSSSVTPTLAHQGVVAEETTVRRTIGAQLDHPVRVGSVHAVGGAVLIARLEGEVRPGDDVALWSDRGAPVARRVPRRSSST